MPRDLGGEEHSSVGLKSTEELGCSSCEPAGASLGHIPLHVGTAVTESHCCSRFNESNEQTHLVL